ncbi:MAG: PH domain-containing protein [Patescibacteria group bacterium]
MADIRPSEVRVTKDQEDRIKRELQAAGAVKFDMLLPETRELPKLIQPDEHILGIVYGRYKKGKVGTVQTVGRGALIATDQRILFLDKKPLFIRCDEIAYEIVSGISYARVAIAGTVAMRTREGEVHIRTFNQKCAEQFVAALEDAIFRQKVKE